MGKKLFTGVVAAALLLIQGMPVFSATDVTVKFDSSGTYASEAGGTDGDIWVCYSLAKETEVMKGQMTVTYDSNYLIYDDSYAYTDEEDALQGMECNISNPKDGTSEEGKVVISFSGSKPVKVKGDMFDVYFNLKEGTQVGQKLDFTLTVDELSNNGTPINTVVRQGSMTVRSDDEAEEDLQDEDETDSETETKKQTPQTRAAGSANSTNSTTAPTETDLKGSNAKTGDVTKILPWIGAGVLAVLILGGLALSRKKDKKE